MNKLD